MSKRVWTNELDDQLRSLYPYKSNREIGVVMAFYARSNQKQSAKAEATEGSVIQQDGAHNQFSY